MHSTLAGIAKAFGHRLPECSWAALHGKLLSDGRAPATINKTLAALRQIMRHAALLGLVDDEEIRKLAPVRDVTGRRHRLRCARLAVRGSVGRSGERRGNLPVTPVQAREGER